MTPDVERELLEYLHAQKTADTAATLRRIADWTQEHTAEDKLRHEEIRGVLRGHSLRIGALEKNDDKLDSKLEKSGSWQLEIEHAKAIEAAKMVSFWKDKTLAIVVGIIMLLLGSGATMLFHH